MKGVLGLKLAQKGACQRVWFRNTMVFSLSWGEGGLTLNPLHYTRFLSFIASTWKNNKKLNLRTLILRNT
jgi:hypothetical protein